MNKKMAAFAAMMLAGTTVSAPAFAQIDAPVPTANYITFGGNDWAWASPCPPSGGGQGTTCGQGPVLDLSYQGTQGWRLPTLAELLAGPSVSDFGTAGNFACASAWFIPYYTHCDYSDAANGAVFGLPSGDVWYAETWVIRTQSAVPEPASWAMMIGGLGVAGAVMRRRAAKVAFA